MTHFAVLIAALVQALPGTSPLAIEGDLATRMVDGIHTYLGRATAESINQRERFWERDYSSAEAYQKSVTPNRERLRKIIGAVDVRPPVLALHLMTTTSQPAQVGKGSGFKVFAVRWPVLDGVTAEGLLLQPDKVLSRVVAVPDADQTPEQLAASWGARLAQNGCQVLIPSLIDRSDTLSGIPAIRMTNQPHREFLLRMAWQVGRHIIGYEVQKVMAAVDWFTTQGKEPVAVAGYGEGGLIALYSAALDARISAALVSGYFGSRQNLWQEPIYRDVWGLLREFGDAEIASLIAPRTLIVEASSMPNVTGPPPETKERRGAAPLGRIVTPSVGEVEREVERARVHFSRLNSAANLQLAKGDTPGSEAAISALLGRAARSSGPTPKIISAAPDRQKRQFDEIVSHVQTLVRQSPERRAELWTKLDVPSKRNLIWEELIGRMPDPSIPGNPRTRRIYDEPKFVGYEVVLDVWPDVIASGILLVPKDLKPGERRPTVVCQHGLEGRPRDVADPHTDNPYYHRYAARLAEAGFITYAPQNPYIGEDRFRSVQRKAHPLKLALFSFIVGQHQRTLEWLASLPFVDPARIGFYGLSYGGKTAMRVPALLDGYALSICSADFNEWVWKTTSVDARYSYLITREYDMLEFDLANIANYAELASLIAPRPFMVERGHHDTVAPDEWVAYEFAKVRRFYTQLGLADKTEIEFFNGPHTINGVGTFEFLKKHLGWK